MSNNTTVFQYPENVTRLHEFYQYVNEDLVSFQYMFGWIMLIAVFVIALNYLKTYDMRSALPSASFITAIISSLFYILNFVPAQAVYGFAILTGLSTILLYLDIGGTST